MRQPFDRYAGTEDSEAGPTYEGRPDRTALLPQAPATATRITLARDPSASEPANETQGVLSRYGAEVRSFLRARTTTRVSMEEVFSAFSEDVWKGLPSVRAGGQVRSWLYVVARNALARHLRRKQRWRSRHVSAELDDLQSEGRRSVATRLGDIAQLAPLLAELREADRRLLEQRSLQGMAWLDIARANARSSGAAEAAEIARESARLRKRYQLLVRSLRANIGLDRDERD